MKILLFITGVYNTIDNLEKKDFDILINKLISIKNEEEYDFLVVTFMDETTNRNIILKYIRWMNEKIENGDLFLGKQFLGNLYYKNIFEPGILYDEEFDKKKIIDNYINELKKNNDVDVIVLDENMNNSNLIKEMKLKKDPFTN